MTGGHGISRRSSGVNPGLSGLDQRLGRVERTVAEVAAERHQKEVRAARGEAPALPGKPSKPIGLPSNYWGDRQRGEIEELLTLLPVVQAVVPMPPLDAALNEDDFNAEVARRTETLMRAFKTIRETVRKGI